jgi:hypothetical protein
LPFYRRSEAVRSGDKGYDGVVLWSMLTVVSMTCFECDVRVSERVGSLMGALACGLGRR